ncbi:g protein-coupled receptor [Apiospora sp. TS-2023a]
MSSYEASPEDSLLHMDNATFNGLLAIGCLATLSFMFTSGLLGFISWRMISWQKFYTSSIGHNQSIVLIYQLLLADLLQSLGFLISFYWASAREIVGPSDACFVQGWLIQLGDVSSAFFVLAIALHTVYQVAFSKSLSHRGFLAAVSSVWGLALLLTSLAPIIGGRYIFQRAGVWCWIKSDHESLRLLLHYLWIFIIEFGSIAVYTVGFVYLYQAKKPGSQFRSDASLESLNKASRAMLAYAIAYTVMTLPLAAGRMASMSHRQPPDSYFFFAGCLFTSSGWVDTVLYAITRRSLLFKEMPGPRPARLSLSDQLGTRRSGFTRQNSTDNILDEDASGFSGIKLETTVKVDVESPTSSLAPSHKYPGHNYSVSAKRHTIRDEMV